MQQRLPQGLRAADGGSVEGSAVDRVSRGIQRRTVEQIVGLLVATVAKTVGEALASRDPRQRRLLVKRGPLGYACGARVFIPSLCHCVVFIVLREF